MGTYGRVFGYIKDVVGLVTGATGIGLMAWHKSWDPIGAIVCAVLMGLPLTRLREAIDAIVPTSEPLSVSQPEASQSSSSSPQP